MNYVVLLITLLLPVSSWAESTLKSPVDLSVANLIASLLLVLACIFICAFLMKKSNLVKQHKNQPLIKVVARQALTNKGQVQIIEVNNTRYLVGVTEQNISLLDTFASPEDGVEELPEDTPTSFAALLSKISVKRHE